MWDVTRASSSDRSRLPHPSSAGSSGGGGQDYSASSDDANARFFDVGSAEGTSSLAWLPGQPTSLVAGIGTRYLRIYDVRGKEFVKKRKNIFFFHLCSIFADVANKLDTCFAVYKYFHD